MISTTPTLSSVCVWLFFRLFMIRSGADSITGGVCVFHVILELRVISQEVILMPAWQSITNCIEECSLPHPRFFWRKDVLSRGSSKRDMASFPALWLTAVNSLCGVCSVLVSKAHEGCCLPHTQLHGRQSRRTLHARFPLTFTTKATNTVCPGLNQVLLFGLCHQYRMFKSHRYSDGRLYQSPTGVTSVITLS